jgi:hypothetical protein
VSHEVVDIQEVMYVLYLMVGWLKSIEYLGIQSCTNSLHRSLSHISASLSHKFGLSYFSLKFIILGFSPSLVTTYSRQNDNGVGNELAERSRKRERRRLFTSVQALFFNIMVSADKTSGPVLQRKERCTFQCALS